MLTTARAGLVEIRLDSRRRHVERVLDSFQRGSQHSRQLQPQSAPRFSAVMDPVRLRLSADLVAQEGTPLRYIYYNWRIAPVDEETARTTLELAHWLLEENGEVLAPAALEYVDLTANRVFRGRTRRAITLRHARASARAINALWRDI